MRRAPSPLARWLLIGAGWLALILGAIGLLLPVVPTTPFILLSAACFARSSERFHAMLLRNRVFGPLIVEWEQYRSIPRRTKRWAILLMALTFGCSIVFFVQPVGLKWALAAVGIAVAIWIWRIPSRD
ncbi:YbaN family protein [Sinimarinibacterium sp. HSW-8]|uniref:Inner membrane protein n=2 Tax=Sinimarinibacterium thermocellulolyticum TaxID=3170016 RepID=A0ABV2ADC9_9GAMM